MLKILVVRFWPVLLPILVYLAWLSYARRKAGHAETPKPGFFDGPWHWAVGAALLMAVGSMVLLGLAVEEQTTEGRYVPARVVDGEIVPGHRAPE